MEADLSCGELCRNRPPMRMRSAHLKILPDLIVSYILWKKIGEAAVPERSDAPASWVLMTGARRPAIV